MAKIPCACCGYLTVADEYDRCPVCGWWKDRQQEKAPRLSGGPNDSSLEESQANYQRIGAVEERKLPRVRPPLPEEYP